MIRTGLIQPGCAGAGVTQEFSETSLCPCSFGAPLYRKYACFPGDVVVHTASGTKALSELAESDSITLPKLDNVERASCADIDAIERHEGRFEMWELTVGQETLQVVKGHLILRADGKWIPIEMLKSGDDVRTLRGNAVVSAVKPIGFVESGTVYNVKVKNHESYAVGEMGLVVRDW